jgi:hypothetical protein
MKAIGAYSSRKKPDGWTFSRAPSHAGEHSETLAVDSYCAGSRKQEHRAC